MSASPDGDAPASTLPPGTVRWSAERIDRVMLLADGDKAVVAAEQGAVEAFLRGRGAEVEVHSRVRDLDALRSARGAAPDLVVVLGGDGSVLTAARLLAEAPVPTIGINFGRVGFLASLEVSAWRKGLEDVFEGRSLVENRMRLEASVVRAGADGADGEVGTVVALNDVVVSRGTTPSMAEFDLLSFGRRVTSYRADGLIFATPSGSTAYSLAAGGPILDPGLRAIVLTPISAHALSHRPLVIGPRAELEVRVANTAGAAAVDVDGQLVTELQEGDVVRLTASETPYPLLTIEGFDPWQRLRDRLGWAGNFDEE